MLHRVVTRDAQPASATVASILVLVTGQLIVDDGQNILQFSQMFHVSVPLEVLQYGCHLVILGAVSATFSACVS